MYKVVKITCTGEFMDGNDVSMDGYEEIVYRGTYTECEQFIKEVDCRKDCVEFVIREE